MIMNGKILLLVRDFQIKRTLIQLFMEKHVHFMECFDEEELDFKLAFYTEGERIFVYEFTNDVTEVEYECIRKIKEKGWKVLAIYPKYSVEYIDASQKIQIDDMLTHPVDTAYVRRKVLAMMNQVSQGVDQHVIQPDTLQEAVRIEINRSMRGNYPLSFVMIALPAIQDEHKNAFSRKLKERLRETDILYTDQAHNAYIMLCPFTQKQQLVEVENKIRDVFEFLRGTFQMSHKGKIYIHGLTLSEDGQSYQEIYEKLLQGIHDSRLLDQREVQDILQDRTKFEAYRNMFKRI